MRVMNVPVFGYPRIVHYSTVSTTGDTVTYTIRYLRLCELWNPPKHTKLLL